MQDKVKKTDSGIAINKVYTKADLPENLNDNQMKNLSIFKKVRKTNLSILNEAPFGDFIFFKLLKKSF